MKSPQQKAQEKKFAQRYKRKNILELEKTLKATANHYRVKIMLILLKNPGLTLDQITELLGGNIKTISGHTRRLSTANLIFKKYDNTSVHHFLTQEGKEIVTFFKGYLG